MAKIAVLLTDVLGGLPEPQTPLTWRSGASGIGSEMLFIYTHIAHIKGGALRAPAINMGGGARFARAPNIYRVSFIFSLFRKINQIPDPIPLAPERQVQGVWGAGSPPRQSRDLGVSKWANVTCRIASVLETSGELPNGTQCGNTKR